MQRRDIAVRFVPTARAITAIGMVIGLMWTNATLSSAHNQFVPAALPSFSVRVIGPATGLDAYFPNALNNSAVVAGTEVTPALDRGFYFAKGIIHGIAPPKGRVGTEVSGIDNNGTIAGTGCSSATCDTATQAFAGQIHPGKVVWGRLPSPSGTAICSLAGCSVANGIGTTGDVAGRFSSRAVLWSRRGNGSYSVARLPYSTGLTFSSSSGTAVDAFGDVVGAETALGTVGVVWPPHGRPGILLDCETVLTRGGALITAPFGVTAKGNGSARTLTIVGKCLVRSQATNTDGYVPCYWKATVHGSTVNVSAPVRLDTNAGSSGGAAVAINEKGWIVGFQGDSSSSVTLWIKHHPYLLSSLIGGGTAWNLVEVYGLNNKGQITAIGVSNGQAEALLLKPR
jgi:hypothetical protein